MENGAVVKGYEFVLAEKCREALERDLSFAVPVPKCVAKKMVR